MRMREDLTAAHDRACQRLARPGTWWTGTERVAIAAEARRATACRLCRQRRDALSPEQVTGTHDQPGDLPPHVVEAVHRIRTDSGRLTEAWFRRMRAAGLSEEHYVELIGIVATVIAVDGFHHALGLSPRPLPAPEPGEPTRRRPSGAKPGGAWVAMVAPEDLTPDDPPIYQGKSGAFIHRALSLVPDEVIGFFDLDDAMYLPDALLRDFGREYRALTHDQIELLAARMSALNRCHY